MTISSTTKEDGNFPPIAATTLWVTLIATLCVGGSFAYACAAPLAAISALAAIKMGRADGLALVMISWLANQAVGYVLLDYPQTTNSFAWGGAIGLAAIAGFVSARAVSRIGLPLLLSLGAAFLAAFAAYETTLYMAGIVLGSSDEAFSLPVVGRILVINAVSFAALIALHKAAVAMSLLKPAERETPAPV